MQVLKGSKREVTLLLWREQLEKARKRLEDSKKCYEIYQDEDSKQWVAEDEQKVEEIEKKIQKVIAYMDENNIK